MIPSITLINKKSVFPRSRIYEVYLDGKYKGRILNGVAKRIPLTKDSVILQIKDTGRGSILLFTTQALKINSYDAQKYIYKIQSGLNNWILMGLSALMILGILSIETIHSRLSYLFILLPILYFFGYRFFNRKKFLYISKELPDVLSPENQEE